MKKFTEKQQKFIDNIAAGMGKEKAAIASGYSANGAAQAASGLLRRPEMKAAIKKARLALGSKAQTDDGEQKKQFQMPKSKYGNPKDFLLDLMNHKGLPLVLRKDAAKDLMPYMHARIGEKGKKENADDAAHEVAGKRGNGKAKPKFAMQAAPNVTPFRRKTGS